MQDVVSLYLVFSPGVSLYVEALFSAGMRGMRSRSELSAADDRILEEPWPETGETMKNHEEKHRERRNGHSLCFIFSR